MISNLNIFVAIISLIIASGVLFLLLIQPNKTSGAKALIDTVLVTIAWLMLELFGFFSVFGSAINSFFFKAAFVCNLLLALFLLRFVLTITKQEINKWTKYAVGLMAVSFSGILLFTNRIVFEIENQLSYNPTFFFGKFSALYAFSIVILLSFSLVLVGQGILKAKNKKVKNQYLSFFLGLLFVFIFSIFTTLKDQEFLFLNYVSVTFMIVSLINSIYKWDAFEIKFKEFKIQNKITFPFVFVTIVMTVLEIFIFYFFATEIFSTRFQDQLVSTIQSRSESVISLIEEQIDTVKMLSSEPYLQSIFSNNQNDEANFKSINYLLENILDSHKDISLINLIKDGNIIVSSIPSKVNTKWEGSTTNDIRSVLKMDEVKVPILVYSIPVYTNTNQIVGYIEVGFNLNKIKRITLNRMGIGDTGNIYILNSHNYIVVSSNTTDDLFLQQKMETESSRQCLNKQKTQLEGASFGEFLDYRNIKVLSVNIYIPETQWCLLAEVEEKEVNEPVNKILENVFLLGFLIILINYIVARILGSMISKPIEKLQQGIEIIERGDLNYKVATDKRDEIGQLSRAFDKMTAAIKKSRIKIESTVKKQTKAIKNQNQKLEEQQVAILNILEDVEVEKDKASTERDKIDLIIQSIGDGVFVVDKEYRIIMFNQISADISGFSTEEVLGKKYNNILRFISEKNENEDSRIIEEVMITGEIKKMGAHTLLVRKDGVKVPVADSAAPLKDSSGNIVGCVVVFRDVTKEREVENMKDEFVSLASHQLRTPLTGIRWLLDSFLKHTKLDEKQKDHLGKMYQLTRQMVQLVNDLLNISRLESGRLRVEPQMIDLVDFINKTIEQVVLVANSKGCKILFEKGDEKFQEVAVDRKLLEQVVLNLLSNAIRYINPEIKNPEIRVFLEKKEKDYILSVIDNGIGIPTEVQEKIFQKFFRAVNAQKVETSGSGVGLYIARMIMESLDGSIWFESEEGKGTKFFVSIPIKGVSKKAGDRHLA